MKKQTKGKRTPPRRKPVRKPQVQTAVGGPSITQEKLDYEDAFSRAMQERMPPAVLEEYLRLLNDYNLSPADHARVTAIFDEYHHPASQEVMDRHLADIAREREQEAAQVQQKGTAT
jgi:hypothetical protein